MSACSVVLLGWAVSACRPMQNSLGVGTRGTTQPAASVVSQASATPSPTILKLDHLPDSAASPTPGEQQLFPDSEIVYSPSAVDFDVAAYLRTTHGFLRDYREYLKSTGWTSAADIVQRVATENSINPRLLLSLLEYHCGCVLGPLRTDVDPETLLGNPDYHRKGLFRQLSWAASRLSGGFYARLNPPQPAATQPTLTGHSFSDGIILPLERDANPGSLALEYFFAFYDDRQEWQKALDPHTGLIEVHTQLFGNLWERAVQVEPLFPDGLTQPDMILPFEPGRLWAYTSGPHVVWETEGAQAALDFAPASDESGCVSSDAWETAVADGRIVRSQFGAVVLDLDGADGSPSDGLEQTGWVVLYMHVAELDRVVEGTLVKTGEHIGHPSCEGGRATGTHLHIARKYNGEWVPADGSLPFNLEGWIAHAGKKPFDGTLTRLSETVVAHPWGSYVTKIIRPTPTPLAVSH